ncbi:hypothetical protein FOTG_10671 [Fusarium oxysporum f. sp. vasinfectum 25433]|uniref:Uncharacterized protein n=1 Tax=Fusarium oxysporum f. sp. vasinfectum 25433 TaxID=1089449 RepID=X0LK85_FUSOX|nr:hypothetical protein FOTG_10671 [Fusarium oxysporum f. sp. vasinfectum 25433]
MFSISADGVDSFTEGFCDGGVAAVVNLGLAEKYFGFLRCTSVEIKLREVAQLRSEGLL